MSKDSEATQTGETRMKTQELFAASDPFALLPAIFRDCAGQAGESIRFQLEHPQPVGEYVVATNGRILVRMLATPEILEGLPEVPLGRFPAMSAATVIGDRSLFEVVPTQVPQLGHLHKCGECDGKGSTPKRRCFCGDFETPCHGKGVIPPGPCWDCDGTGIADAANEFIELREDVKLAARYLFVLAKHGATLYLPAEPNTPTTHTPVYFTVEGGVEGVLMPAQVTTPSKLGATT